MRITRLRLRNYRVFAGEVEVEVPPGLVGVYGPNGAGKSSLVEAIPFALFGSSRTGNDQVRTSGVDEESLVEVELEHEGHLYSVRRTISGVNHTVKARASADGHHVAEGVRDTNRYLRSILGIDDASFRASVFAEQKQLAAFSGSTPAKRRDLVLKLLGITPLDAARDRARSEARAALHDLERLRGLLPDLEALAIAAEHEEAAAWEARRVAQQSDTELGERRRQLGQARRTHEELAVRAAEHETLVTEGREVRRQHDALRRRMDDLTAELADLADAEVRCQSQRADADGLEEVESRIRALAEVARAEQVVAEAEITTGPEPLRVEEAALARVQHDATEARAAYRAHQSLIDEVRRHRSRAATACDDAAGLSDEADCPLCGQGLGQAFAAVRSHRQKELADADARVAELTATEITLAEAMAQAELAARDLGLRSERARRSRAEWDQSRAALAGAQRRLDEARSRLDRPAKPGGAAVLTAEAERRRQARAEHQRLQGRLERAPLARAQLEELRHDDDTLCGRLATLREKVRSLGFSGDDLATARHAFELADAAQSNADQACRRTELTAARAEAQAEAARQRLAIAEHQHDQLGGLEDEARHLGRLAELMGDFRNQLVGAVGPRLSRQAASLFAELTDAEYDDLQVDPDTYGIEILDQGVAYGLDRFSGSESDLASLALRVAISEHLCFQSGGQIGLLVLDEVFGPLDADRKDRMLRALERLKGRFRQVLVVTHDDDIKDQLPTAIEVVKLPGRRATARVVAGP
ncbi:MAG TPA: SMC family ATPase [Acidimicrobiales bacterium]|nr:SMC family ATPase [Acidimicrobiales bacterium]